MKTVQKTKNEMGFIIETNEVLANAIRRSVNEIPTIAIDEVEIQKNDSALYDEIIAHRLGLIPLKEKRKLSEFEKCSCDGKGCNKCQIQIAIKIKGPITVYSDDLKGDVEIIYEKMPIVILDKDQEFQAICFARLGKAIKHAKFSPGLTYYRNISEIKIKNSNDAEEVIKIISDELVNPPKGKIKNGEVYESIKDIDSLEILSKKNNDCIEIKPGGKLVFIIESWGQKDPKEVFKESVDTLNKNLNEVLKVIKK
ncbi:MAG TPA: DNA-directed RNA polymerase subunit D [Candidatus Paceibacterota bacterium]|nr:DNA-directed RNA polymerase subunit D [Candidatus Paceibacterota bacterium]